MKNFKIRIGNNPELSELVQKKAFELGYQWHEHGKILSYLDSPEICIVNEQYLFTNARDCKEISIPDFLELEPERDEVPEVPTKKLLAHKTPWDEIRYFNGKISKELDWIRAPEYDLEF